MNINFALSQSEAERLESMASKLGVRVEDLAKAALSDLVEKREEDFEEAVGRVLKKNAELYRRLS